MPVAGGAKKAEAAPKAKEAKGAPAASQAAPAAESRTPGGHRDVPNNNIRKITAQRLLESKQKARPAVLHI